MENKTCSKKSKCHCDHEYQDKLYGKKVRIFNRCVKNGKDNGWRCTVCGSVKMV